MFVRTARAFTTLSFLACAGITAALLSFFPSLQNQPEVPGNYQILVTNDDGIDAPGLHELVKALSALGSVTVVAPDRNRSGSSHSIDSIQGPMVVTPRTIAHAQAAYAASGKPADAVALGLIQFGPPSNYDIVVSGINAGANVGLVAHYSGTVGAACEALYHGVPAVAVSLEKSSTHDYSLAANFAMRFVEELLIRGPVPGVLYSINVPSHDSQQITGTDAAPMGGSFFRIVGYQQGMDQFGNTTYQPQLDYQNPVPGGSDSEAYQQGRITVTPLRLNWTDSDALAELESWGLGWQD